MPHNYEPDADAALDSGSEPPATCKDCGASLEPDEGSLCSSCEAEAVIAYESDIPDEPLSESGDE